MQTKWPLYSICGATLCWLRDPCYVMHHSDGWYDGMMVNMLGQVTFEDKLVKTVKRMDGGGGGGGGGEGNYCSVLVTR